MGVANIDLQNRAPAVTRTPDFREHVERRYDVLNWIPKTPADILAECWKPLGTLDDEYTNCYLIEQRVEGQNGDFYAPCKYPPVLVRVFEQLNGTAETQVGDPGVVMDQYGNQSVIIDYWQINLGTATYQVPGFTPAPAPFTDCLLKNEERTNDGTLRKIRRTYIDSGILSDTETLKFDGKLVIREITAIGLTPPTPAGWTLVTTSTEFVNGREVVRVGFANAGGGGGGGGSGGVVSEDTQYNISPDQGTTGVTVKTIRWVSNPDVVVNPIPSPGAGYELIREGCTDEDGYRMWESVFASGQGTITSDKDIKEGGKLIVYSITSINAPPSAPSPTIGGTVTLITQNQRNGTDAADGTVIYQSVFTEGFGEISRETDYSQSNDQGTTGVTKITIRALTALGAGNPISVPATTTLIAIGSVAQGGYLAWTGVYAKGTGTVVSDTEIKEGGKLYLYHKIGLGLGPTAPAPSIGGVVTLIEDDSRMADGYVVYERRWAEGLGEIGRSFNVAITGDPLSNFDPAAPQENDALVICTIRYLSAGTAMMSLADPTTGPSGFFRIEDSVTAQDGYCLWVSTYARGNGMVVDDQDIENGGKLIIYHRVGLNAAPDAPDPTIGGSVVLISSDVTSESNYHRYDYRWAEGIGEIGRDVQYQQSEDQGTLGVTITTIRYLVAPAATQQPAALGGSVNIGANFTEANGYRIWTTKWAKGTGKVSEMIHARQDFLREVTYISLGSRVAPAVGIIIRDDYRLDEGFSVFTVTSIQSAGGGAVTTATGSFERYVPFLYPGRAKAYFLTASNGWEAYDVFRSPPVRTDVRATVLVTYQTTSTLGTISNYWNPTEWATVQAEWIGLDNLPGFNVVSLPGYRTVDDTPLVFTASIWEDGVAGTMLGNIVFGGTIAQVTVTGGPSDPGGHTFTLDATVEPAFTATDGTVYYRKTVVTADIPAQGALPV